MEEEKLIQKTVETVVSKRDDPAYSQVSGHIPNDLALKFKIACTTKQISNSDGLEQAVRLWLEQDEAASTPAEAKRNKGR
jgi:hypothetical protein